jgi:hypothetical protein
MDAEQFAAATSAAMSRAKLAGLLVDKVEVGGPGAFDHVETIEDVVRLMLADQTPIEALELLDVLRRQVEVFAADHAVPIGVAEPARSRPDEVGLALGYLRRRR